MRENREILKGLDDLLDGAGNKFGPILLDELQDRLSIAVKKFDLELKGILELSFRNYHIQHDHLKMLMDQNCNPIKEVENKKITSIESDIPEFIKKFDEKESI
jgi:anaerobic ribonucleoside-triphosphate reductase|tara:strand:+ start:961 stop:1269 length:309 start_codon:yes stop_codon:yes gene_type:complete